MLASFGGIRTRIGRAVVLGGENHQSANVLLPTEIGNDLEIGFEFAAAQRLKISEVLIGREGLQRPVGIVEILEAEVGHVSQYYEDQQAGNDPDRPGDPSLDLGPDGGRRLGERRNDLAALFFV